MKQLTREELYTQVWSIPMRTLAADYGLSDVGLAKICKKNAIPRPPRGYWAKIQSGRKPPQTLLPRRSSSSIIEIRQNPGNNTQSKSKEEFQEQDKLFAGPSIIVSKALRNPHRLVQQTARLLEVSKTDENGLLKLKANCLDIQVSEKLLKRALRIMDALLQAMVLRGFDLFIEKGETWVHISGDDLHFGIKEEFDSKKVAAKDLSLNGYYHFNHSRFEYIRVPSGRLCLTIHDIRDHYMHDLRKNWRDTATKKLENQLDGFMRGLMNLINQKKTHQRKKEEHEQRRLVWQQQHDEKIQRLIALRQQVEAEKQRIAALNTDAANLHKSRLIRQLIEAVEKEHCKSDPVYEPASSDLNAWIQWASDHADRLDPLAMSPPSLLDIETELEEEERVAEQETNPFYSRFYR